MKSVLGLILSLLLTNTAHANFTLEQEKALALSTVAFTTGGGSQTIAITMLTLFAGNLCSMKTGKIADFFHCAIREGLSVVVQGTTAAPNMAASLATAVARGSAEISGIKKEAAKIAQADAMHAAIEGQAQYELTKILIQRQIEVSGQDKDEAARTVAEALQDVIDNG
jgi:hypothetical protein